jgi:hypothetical protein
VHSTNYFQTQFPTVVGVSGSNMERYISCRSGDSGKNGMPVEESAAAAAAAAALILIPVLLSCVVVKQK